MKIVPIKYLIEGEDRVYIEVRNLSKSKWVVSNDDYVMENNCGDFIYQPLPSNRDDEFKKTTEFDSVDEALAAYEKFHSRNE